MEATDALARILTELLIENATMKSLLKTKQTVGLAEILTSAKADPTKQLRARELATKLKDALSQEAALEQLMEKIAETSDQSNLRS